MDKKSQKILYWIVLLISFAPLFFFKPFLGAVAGAKTFYVHVLAEAALPFYVYLLIRNKSFRPDLKNVLNFSILVFFGINALSAILGANFSQSFWGSATRYTGVFDLAHYVLLFFYIQLLIKIRPEFLRKLQLLIVWVAAISSLYAIWVMSGLPQFIGDDYWPGRISGLSGNPIFFAGYLLIPLFLTIAEAVNREEIFKKVLYFGIAILDLTVIYFTKTRGAYVGLFGAAVLVVLLYILLTQNERIKKYKYYILGSGLVFSVLLGFMISSKLNLNNNDSKARLINWKIALKGFQQDPILGSGPENYYIYANKFFDPKLYLYDPGWFDKPHNYFLEVLSTTGILGLASYLLIFFAASGLLYRVYRDNSLTMLDSLLLWGGLVAFGIQAFFSFDTPSTLIIFYLFLGLASGLIVGPAEQKNNLNSIRFAPWGMGITVLLSIYLIFTANIVPALAGIYTRRGGEATSTKIAKTNLDKALGFDTPIQQQADIGSYYLSFIQQSLQLKDDIKFSDSAINKDIALMEMVTDKIRDNPRYWYRIASLYYLKASVLVLENQDYSRYQQKSEEAINKSLELVPGRIEFMLLSAKLKLLRKNYDGMDADLANIFSEIPENHSAAWYYDSSKQDVMSSLDFLIGNLESNKDFNRVIALYNEELKIESDDPQIYAGLAAAYAQKGDKQSAKATAEKIIQINPGLKDEVDQFLQTLE